ncbi:LysR substrate-binding domain-containing protein [Brevundimonas sp.]|uniref:LysR family transcriptional regulator n=1 Tax=Brevundimonas sp. TaxID=1871086 RepID=UPI00289F0841|nr:LysR substrate-binding domain-containing protein [Brevundimonas sp.]
MLRKAPPLESVEVFVAAARGGSFRAVARDMALSPSAVSRRIAGLEEFLGVTLFDRSGLVPVLSAAGLRYLERVEPGLRTITDATDDMAAPRSGRLRVTASHSFASIWLLPRLAKLLEETGVDVELVVGAGFDALTSNAADIGIWGGRVAPNGLETLPLFDVTAVPVCPERLANGRTPPRSGDPLGDFPLVSVHRPKDLWRRWLGAPPRHVRSFDTLHMMYEASAAGLGVALATPLLSEPFLASGRLRVCSTDARPLGLSYALFHPSARPTRTVDRLFVDWTRSQIAESVKRFEQLTC